MKKTAIRNTLLNTVVCGLVYAAMLSSSFADTSLNVITATATSSWVLNGNGAYYASATATCPAGYIAVGAGAYCNSHGGTQVSKFSTVASGSNGAYSSCVNIGNPISGGINVQVRCMQNNPSIAVTIVTANGNWQYQPSNAAYYATAVATCPAGYMVTGGGGNCQASGGLPVNHANNPNGNGYYSGCVDPSYPGAGVGITTTAWCVKQQ